ncbi:hypothetical protein KY285_000340 [Solanum tuberosum]|nr:hypothetical protein KY285_000340 [Solanum tuberosum]
MSLLEKWPMRYAREENSLWREVIHKKYGTFSHWCTKTVNTRYGVSIWKSIRALWDVFAGNTELPPGNGRTIAFWNDKWIGQEPLKFEGRTGETRCSQSRVPMLSLVMRAITPVDLGSRSGRQKHPLE